MNRTIIKKILPVFLALVCAFFVVLSFSGCAGNSETKEETTKTETVTEKTTKEETTTEKKTTKEKTTKEETTKETETETTTSEAKLPEDSSFEIHFIDVGQGDSSLIICDGEAMLLDGGTSKNSSLIYSYLKKLGINHLKYIIGSHADSDHVGGLSGALNYADAEIAYCNTLEDESDAFNDFKRYLGDTKLVVPEFGTKISLGSATGEVIGPVVYNNEYDDNNNSLVIRMEYGNTSFLFTGDAEAEEELEIIYSGAELKSTLLKVGHHGSKYSTSNKFLEKVDPEYAVISVGTSNSYGHPHNSTLSKLQEKNVQLLRTDLHGDIIVRSDGESLSFETEKETDIDPFITYEELNPTTQAEKVSASEGSSNADEHTFVLNTNTKKIHKETCNSVSQMKEKNKKYVTGTRDEILAEYEPLGYAPCGNCHAMY